MNFESLEDIANHIVSDGKGILAADESTPTTVSYTHLRAHET